MFNKNRRSKVDPELDITSFMSLMIVLVPVLLMMMVFSHISILELKLPTGITEGSAEENEVKELELIVRADAIALYYPKGALLKAIPLNNKRYDYPMLQQALKEVKFLLAEKGIDKKDITILLDPEIDYQTIVNLMDAVRSYKAVVAASVVDAELFPEISLADAPDIIKENAALTLKGAQL